MDEVVVTLLTEILKLLAIVVMAWVTPRVIKFLDERFDESQQEVIREVVKDGVLFAQQVYDHLDGPGRYNKAVERITARLNALGLEIEESQMKTLIEAVLKELKSEYGDNW